MEGNEGVFARVLLEPMRGVLPLRELPLRQPCASELSQRPLPAPARAGSARKAGTPESALRGR